MAGEAGNKGGKLEIGGEVTGWDNGVVEETECGKVVEIGSVGDNEQAEFNETFWYVMLCDIALLQATAILFSV